MGAIKSHTIACGIVFWLGLLLAGGARVHAELLPVKTYTTTDGLARNAVYGIVQDPRGFLWFSTPDGLSRFDGYRFTNYGPEAGLPKGAVTALQITWDGVYWVGTSAGLFRFDPSSPPPQRFESVSVGANEHARRITALVEDHSGALWAGTDDGLYRLEASSRSVFQPVDVGIPKRVDGKRIVDILLEDRRGSLWIAGEGIYRRRMPDGHIIIYRDSCPPVSVFAPGALALYEDRKGRLWAASGHGLCRLNPGAGPNDPIVTRVYTMKDGLPQDWVEAMLETSDGRFWVGAARGLSYYVPEADRFEGYTRVQGLSDAGIKSLAEDREGNLWVGTEAGGVMKIAGRGFTSYTEADGLANTRVSSIFVDQAGELCTVTSTGFDKWVLNCFNGKRFTPVHPDYPAAIHYFGWSWNQTAFQDHTGEWWIPTGRSLPVREDKARRTTGRTSTEGGLYDRGRPARQRHLSPL